MKLAPIATQKLERYPRHRIAPRDYSHIADRDHYLLTRICWPRKPCAIGTCDNWTIGPRFRLVRTFGLALPSGRAALGETIPRVETLG